MVQFCIKLENSGEELSIVSAGVTMSLVVVIDGVLDVDYDIIISENKPFFVVFQDLQMIDFSWDIPGPKIGDVDQVQSHH